jgi:Ca-activated chloride channel family protein
MLVMALLGAAVMLTVSTLTGQSGPGRNGRIEGIISNGARTPLPAVQVQLIDDAKQLRHSTQTDARGRFVFVEVQPGRYDLVATLAGFTAVNLPITVKGSAAESLALVMRAVRVAPRGAPAPSNDQAIEGGTTGQVAGIAERARQFSVMPGPPAPRGVFLPKLAVASPFNTETYNSTEDHHWTDARRKPLSTFSIDVDTASYANVRRFLNSGQVPPRDAVRIEELINYFAYDYAQPRAAEPFSVTTALGASPWHPGYRLVLVGLQARRMATDSLPPRNLVFLIDVSGSMMQPNKLPLVKASLAMLAQNLTPRDHVAIVVYAGAAGLVLPPTSGDDRSSILEALGRLEAGGSTNGAGGLLLAYRTAATHYIKGGVNRIILATDGDFNVGVTSQGELIRLIEERRSSGIALSVLGFGMGNLKDAMMEQIADKGNGNYSYIDDLSEARKVLVEEAGGTLVTVAKDVKLQVEFNPGTVAAYRLIGYENRALADRDFNDDGKDAGELGAGHAVTALYEIVPVGQRIDMPGIDPLKYQDVPTPSLQARSGELLTVKIRHKQPEATESTLLSRAVSGHDRMTPELGFASAVAEFGMLLRGSDGRGTASFDAVRRRAEQFRGRDVHGHRGEFVRLVGLAESLTRQQPDVTPNPPSSR